MIIRWYNNLHLGKKAQKKRYGILEAIRQGAFQPDVYVITPADSAYHILDIYPLLMLQQKKEDKREYIILGIGFGYQEALEVARDLIDELYQSTHDFQLDQLLHGNIR